MIAVYDIAEGQWHKIEDSQENINLLKGHANELGKEGKNFPSTEALEELLNETSSIDTKEIIECTKAFVYLGEW